MIPAIGETIIVQWGEEYVEARVVRLWESCGFETGELLILDRTNPKMFAGSSSVVNFDWAKLKWVYA